jgi:putative transposase
MSTRTPLLQSKGQYFHVYNRGVNRENIFFREQDYRLFLRIASQCLDGIGMVILAYCLMPNHFHFALRQDEPYAMPQFFKQLCETYAKATNAINGRVGHLFQGPYKPKLVHEPETLSHLSRYIHRNPVEANMVSDPNQWEYSSSREYCGLRPPSFAETSIILDHLGGPEHYRDYLSNASDTLDENLGRCLVREV